ncbi:hypothetical protein D3C72_1583960 [compost metagenome]
MLCGFHHNCVSSHSCCCHHAGQNRQREIPWSNNCNHTTRFVNVLRNFTRQTTNTKWFLDLAHIASIVTTEVDRFAYVTISFRPWFTNFHHLRCDQLETIALHDVCKSINHRRTLFRWNILPSFVCSLCRLHRLFCVFNRSHVDLTHNLRSIRRIHAIKDFFCANFFVCDHQRNSHGHRSFEIIQSFLHFFAI